MGRDHYILSMSRLSVSVPVLSDGAVCLRPFSPEDADALVAIWQDPEIQRRNTLPAELSTDAARAWVTEKAALVASGAAWEWAITDATTGQLAGRRAIKEPNWADLRAVSAVWVAAEFRGRRYAARSLRLAAAHVFASGIARIQAECEADNAASCRSLLAAGLKHEGTLRSYFITNAGHRVDAECFSLVPSDLDSAGM